MVHAIDDLRSDLQPAGKQSYGDPEIYLNGQRMAVFAGYVAGCFTALADALANAIVVGDNSMAIHCHNAVGGQFIDAGIEVGTELKQPEGQ